MKGGGGGGGGLFLVGGGGGGGGGSVAPSVDGGYEIKYYLYCMISNVFFFRDCWSPKKVGRNLTCNSNKI